MTSAAAGAAPGLTEPGKKALGLVLAITSLALAANIAVMLATGGDRAQTMLAAALLVALVIGLLLHRSRHHLAAVGMLVTALMVFAIGTALAYGSIRSIGTVVMVGGVVAAGLFLDRRASIATVVFGVLSLAALVAAETSGMLPAPRSYQVTFLHWLEFSTVLACTGMAAQYSRELLLGALASASASAERFRSVFRIVPVALAITRARDGRLLEVNPADGRFLGYTREEALARTSLETAWIDPSDRERFLAVLAANGVVDGFETRLHRKQGEVIDAQMWAAPIEVDGEPAIVTAAINVTEKKREESMILDLAAAVAGQSGERLFRTLTEHLSRALGCEIVICGEMVSGEAVRTLAFTKDGALLPAQELRITDTPCAALPPQGQWSSTSDDVAQRFPAAAKAIDSRVKSHLGARLRDAEGRWIGLFCAYGYRPQTPTPRTIALFQIFAARAEAELRQLRADRELQQLHRDLENRVRERTSDLESFSYSVSHDLRAPLRAISGMASILRLDHGDVLPAQAIKRLEAIDQNAKHMGLLIDDLLEFSRLGLASVARVRIDATALVREVLQQLGAASPLPPISVEDLAHCVGDAPLLTVVWRNLLENAVKYTGRVAEPRITVRSVRHGGAIEYSVTDNGAGFDPAYGHKLFQVFERLHSIGEFEGTGVGLAIVKRIVVRHGGTVAACGTPGGGATFSFTLPDTGAPEFR